MTTSRILVRLKLCGHCTIWKLDNEAAWNVPFQFKLFVLKRQYRCILCLQSYGVIIQCGESIYSNYGMWSHISTSDESHVMQLYTNLYISEGDILLFTTVAIAAIRSYFYN